MNLAVWHSKRIRGLARVNSVAQGETDTLTLLCHDDNENGGTLIGFTPPLFFPAGTWTKAQIKPAFDGFNDGAVLFTEELQLPEDALTAAQANLVLAVQIGDAIKKARLTVGPNGLQRYWRFEITPMQ
jgi:hypothetical protein